MLPILATASAQEHNLFMPPLYDVLWSVVVIVPIFVVFLRYGLPKINANLDRRAELIESGLTAAQRAKEAEAQAKRNAEAVLAEANAQAGEIRSNASEDAKGIVAKARKDAEQEAARIIENAQRQIQAERQAAEISLKTDIGMLATELAEKLIGEHLRDTELTARVVDRFLDDLDMDTATQEA